MKLNDFACKKCKGKNLDFEYNAGSSCPSCGYDSYVEITCLDCRETWSFES